MSNEDMKTAMFEQAQWLPPVETRQDLPTEDIGTGVLCFVEDEGAVYRYEDGRWLIEAARPE